MEVFMATLLLSLTEDDRRKAESRARELGYATLEAYLHALLASDIESPVSDEIEEELLQALKSPSRELTPADWDAKRRHLIERHQQAKAG
jgi:hypothetical protein